MRSRLSPSGMLRSDGPRRRFSSDIADLDREYEPVQVACGLATPDRRRAGVAMAKSLGAISVDQFRPGADNRWRPEAGQDRLMDATLSRSLASAAVRQTLCDSFCPQNYHIRTV